MKIFRNGKIPEAFTWNVHEEKWDKLGEVTSSKQANREIVMLKANIIS